MPKSEFRVLFVLDYPLNHIPSLMIILMQLFFCDGEGDFGHFQRLPGTVPGSVLRNGIWRCSGGVVDWARSWPLKSSAKQVPHSLFNLSFYMEASSTILRFWTFLSALTQMAWRSDPVMGFFSGRIGGMQGYSASSAHPIWSGTELGLLISI